MDLRQLEHFLAVAEEGQFTRAARRCHLAQSALSASILNLERELGTSLFRRTTRRVTLTEPGIALLPEARRTVSAAEMARAAVHEAAGVVRGTLSIGGVATPGELDQAAALARLRAEHPGLSVRYVRAPSAELVAAVQGGDLDIAVVVLPARAPAQLRLTRLRREPIALACRRDHRLAERHLEVTPDMLASETFVSPPPGLAFAEAVDRAFDDSGINRDVAYTVNDPVTMLDLVATGVGVALAPCGMVVSRPELCAVALAGRKIEWTLVAAMPESPGPAAVRALHMLKQVTAESGPAARATLRPLVTSA